MDFFERQDLARRKTRAFIFLYTIAILLTTTLLSLAVFVGVGFYYRSFDFPPYVAPLVILFILAVIGWGSFSRFRELSGGGIALAKLTGSSPIAIAPHKPELRRLLNVVEEMAIASGMPIPDIYVLENEPGINAFVAGMNPHDTVLVVTEGCMKELSRSELQGVIGHEFSHILNGDVRLNTRLSTVLAGVILLGKTIPRRIFARSIRMYPTGDQILEKNPQTSAREIRYQEVKLQARLQQFQRDGYTDAEPSWTFYLMPFALSIAPVGYLGVLIARIIKAAISRQREFLADAASVQFTRDPFGLIGALEKIWDSVDNALMKGGYAEDISHMWFALGGGLFSRLLATHPPIEERITAIGKFKRLFPQKKRERQTEYAFREAMSASTPDSDYPEISSFSGSSVRIRPEGVFETIGNPSAEHLQYAEAVVAAIPNDMLDAAHQSSQVTAIVYALVFPPLADETPVLDIIAQRESEKMAERVAHFAGTLRSLGPRIRLPLIDICMPALKKFSLAQRVGFLNTVRSIVHADRKVELFEFAIQAVLEKNLFYDTPGSGTKTVKSFEPVTKELAFLISMMSYVGGSSVRISKRIFTEQVKSFRLDQPRMTAIRKIDEKRLYKALSRLNRLTMLLKKQVIWSCIGCILWDEKVEVAEVELLRAICETLECPMPPVY
jgi:Zn-dependent protease with chaperone function